MAERIRRIADAGEEKAIFWKDDGISIKIDDTWYIRWSDGSYPKARKEEHELYNRIVREGRK